LAFAAAGARGAISGRQPGVTVLFGEIARDLSVSHFGMLLLLSKQADKPLGGLTESYDLR